MLGLFGAAGQPVTGNREHSGADSGPGCISRRSNRLCSGADGTVPFSQGGPLALEVPHVVQRTLALLHIDFAPTHRQPKSARVATATIAAVVASLLADAALVAIGTAVFPSTHGYVHFGFADYAKLTLVGVVVACLAWPVVTRVSSAPRWLYLRLAGAVTLILWIPDLWIVAKGQPPEAVAVLMAMHLAIAVITYNCVVHIARVTKPETAVALASSG